VEEYSIPFSLISGSVLKLNHISFLSVVVDSLRVITEVKVTQLIANVLKIYHSIITYNHIRVVVIVNEFSIIVDILIVRESLMIMRFFNLAYVLPGHITSECSLNLYNKRNLIWVSESVSSILIE
jgi:hypothetical protein